MKLKHLFIALIGVAMIGLVACTGSDDVVVKYSELPAPVKQFLGTHFAGEKVQTVKADTDDTPVEYDVIFTSGTKVEINATGAWQEICNATAAVPVTMLPDATQAYIAANYPNEKVVKVDKDRKGYEVKFASGTELEFDTQGTFRKVDK